MVLVEGEDKLPSLVNAGPATPTKKGASAGWEISMRIYYAAITAGIASMMLMQ